MFVGEMGARRRHADRTDSQLVRACKELIDLCDEEEARLIRLLAADHAAAFEGFADDPRIRLARRREKLSLVLNETDFRFRECHGRGLRTFEDYLSVRRPGEPSYKSFNDVFGSWHEARRYSGLASIPYPEAHLVVREGRPPKDASRKRTHTDHVKSIAQSIEHHRGLRPSTDQYKTWQLSFGRAHSTYNQIIGTGKKGGTRRSWQAMVDEAVEWILDHPEAYPYAYPVLKQTLDARRAREDWAA